MNSDLAAASGVASSGRNDECPFKCIPPEIRNRIYEFTFANKVDSTVELLETKPASKALLLTCRQIYEDAKHMYRAAYRQFWSEENFKITLRDSRSSTRKQERNSIEALDGQDLSHIRGLSVQSQWRCARRAMGFWYLTATYATSTPSLMGPDRFVLVPEDLQAMLTERGHSHFLQHYSSDGVMSFGFETGALEQDQEFWETARSAARETRLTKDELIAVVCVVA